MSDVPEDDALIARLRASHGVAPSPGFSADVVRAIRQHRRERQNVRVLGMLVTGIALGFGIRLWQAPPQVPSPQLHAAKQGVRWLLAHREADGAWPAEAGGGHARFTPGVTALATLALMQAPDGISPETLLPSIHYLDGRLAELRHVEGGPQAYNPLLVLRALLEFESRYPDAARRGRLQAALHHVARQQERDGGWGYGNAAPLGYAAGPGVRSNSAVTWWVCEVLRDAERQGFAGLRPHLRKGEAWLAERFPEGAPPRYRAEGPGVAEDSALFWMARIWEGDAGAIAPGDAREERDYYRDVFRSHALRGDQRQRDHLHRRLVLLQGEDGAWQGPDRWWLAGGRTYATAAAILALSPRG